MNVKFRTALVLSAVVAVAASTGTVAATTALDSTSAQAQVQTAADTPRPPTPGGPPPKAVGVGPGAELLYVPIAPCRIVDTRKAGGSLAKETTRSFVVKGSSGFTAQGGASGGCGIPAGAQSASFSFTTTSSAGKGRLTAWPTGGAASSSTVLSYRSSYNVTANPIVGIAKTGSPHLTVRNGDYRTHLVIDVTGYYIGQMYAYVNPSGSITASSRAVSVVKSATGVYSVTFDSPLTGCVAVANADYAGYIVNTYPSGGSSYGVYVFSHSGVPTDYYFNIMVTC